MATLLAGKAIGARAYLAGSAVGSRQVVTSWLCLIPITLI